MSLSSEQQESLKVIAKEAAREAIELFGRKLSERDDKLREDIIEDVRRELKTYFGEQAPSVHIVQHAQLVDFLKWLDALKKNFWSGFVASVMKYGTTLGVGALLYSKLHG